ncbi:hypothetical protein HJC23_008033 [Cyclotella cryptica]|uniref:Uncharacterized protein n=1 Tax=Cyclotella cryptica TaxID=29204 RepID=A0ABD3Q2R0_9STRA
MDTYCTIIAQTSGKYSPGEEGNETLLQHLDRVLYQTIYLSEEFSPKELSGTILGIAKIVQNARRMCGGPESLEVSPHPVHQVFLGDTPDYLKEIMRPFTETVVHFIKDYDARCLSNVCYAYALLGMNPRLGRGNNFFRCVADEVCQKGMDFHGQDISNTVWAFATMKASNSRVFGSLGDAVAQNDALLSSMTPLELSNTVWAFATSNQSHHDLFVKVGDVVARRNDLRMFEPRHLSMTAWAFATANELHPAMFKKMGDTIARYENLKAFKPQELALTAWAFATSNVDNPRMFKKIGDTIARYHDIRIFQAQHLTMIVSAFATAKVSHQNMFKKIGDSIVKDEELRLSLSNENISKIVEGFTALNVRHRGLLDKLDNAGERTSK